MNSKEIRILAAALALFILAAMTHAQQAPPPNQPTPDSSSNKPQNSSGADTGPAQADAPQYNPYRAQNDVDVATYYMRKGDPDASIPRLEEAIQLQPNFAKPRLMLAEIYEKKRDNEKALQYYKEYLQVFPHAPDAKKVQAKIAKLSAQ